MIPCQDASQVKSSFTAEVEVDEGFVVLLGAKRTDEAKKLASKPGRTVFTFRQDVPIPSYLIAMAVGDLKSKKIGKISTLWAEEGYLETAAHDFSQVDDMMKAAESIAGPYRFGIFDILVMPPAYPLGGMENPCLTFLTPTVLTGDRSLANVLAHELSHSWFGNLVTQKSYNHFWLNEGFTTFMERKIAAALTNETCRKFAAKLGYIELQNLLRSGSVEGQYTRLVSDLKGVDPSEALNLVPYEKGHTFLWYLEQTVGGQEKMNGFLRSYVDKYAFKSITSEEMKQYFIEYFKDANISGIDWDEWFNGTGLPKYVPDYHTQLEDDVEKLVQKWTQLGDDLSKISQSDIKDFSPTQLEVFLHKLDNDSITFSKAQMDKMAKVYNFGSSPNAEILVGWLKLGLRNRYEPVIVPTKDFMRKFGRMKYLRPLMGLLYRWEEHRQEALELLEELKPQIMKASRIGLESVIKTEAKKLAQ